MFTPEARLKAAETGARLVPGHAEVGHLHHQSFVQQTVPGSLQRKQKYQLEKCRFLGTRRVND